MTVTLFAYVVCAAVSLLSAVLVSRCVEHPARRGSRQRRGLRHDPPGDHRHRAGAADLRTGLGAERMIGYHHFMLYGVIVAEQLIIALIFARFYAATRDRLFLF